MNAEDSPVLLEELMRGLPLAPGAGVDAGEVDVSGVTHDSRRVAPGDLFVAVTGAHHDGRAYAGQAVERGAVAVLGAPPAPMIQVPGKDLPWVESQVDPRTLLGPLAARLYGHPDRELSLVGITGTNGKSTVATLVAAILDAADRPAGLLGTLGYRFRDHSWAGEHTTPEASDLFRILRQMCDAGARSAAMEVSSHALSLGRVEGARFSVAAFLNLSRDHFDFHGDFESYYAAKRRLFDQLAPGGRAVVGLYDEWGRRLAEELRQRGTEVLTFGPGGGVAWSELEVGLHGLRGTLTSARGELAITSPLVGRFNAENLAAAVAVTEALELPAEASQRALAAAGPLPGRLEPIPAAAVDLYAFVDFAHTDAALRSALESLRELGDRQLVVVFGCGGDRDRGKRPLMGRAAGELADLVVLTSDNPRTEDPQEILRQAEEGLKASGNSRYRVIPDRREAIHRAVAAAEPGAIVLVAGKGHEQGQVLADRTIPFSDQAELTDALAVRAGSRSPQTDPDPEGHDDGRVDHG